MINKLITERRSILHFRMGKYSHLSPESLNATCLWQHRDLLGETLSELVAIRRKIAPRGTTRLNRMQGLEASRNSFVIKIARTSGLSHRGDLDKDSCFQGVGRGG